MALAAGTYAIFNTTEGKITVRLFETDAPLTVKNFIELAEGAKEWSHPTTRVKSSDKLYDGTVFHRVIPDFMIQGGDPKGTGNGEIGINFKNEPVADLKFDRPGRLAYANAGPGTNGSQFFVTEAAYPSLNGSYTIFGQCDDASVELVKKISRVKRDSNDKPYTAVIIKHIKIDEGGTAKPTATKKPVAARKTATN